MRNIDKIKEAELRIQINKLAEEARLTRREEIKWFGSDKQYFKNLRKWNIRNEARAAQLALAFLLGKSYRSIESTCVDHGKRNCYITQAMRKVIMEYSTFDFKLEHNLIYRGEEDFYKFENRDIVARKQEVHEITFLNPIIKRWFYSTYY